MAQLVRQPPPGTHPVAPPGGRHMVAQQRGGAMVSIGPMQAANPGAGGAAFGSMKVLRGQGQGRG